MKAMKWKAPRQLSAMAFAAATACGGLETSQSELALDETAGDVTDTTMDGLEGHGPRPAHALLRECSASEVPPGLLIRGAPGHGERERPENRPQRGGRPPREGRGRGHGEHRRPPAEVGSSTTAGHGHGRGRGGLGRLAWVYDANGDRALDATEAAAFQADLVAGCEARNARLLASYDADGDGALSEAELAAAQAAIDAAHAARRAASIAEFDSDGDGELSREERRAMREARRAALLAAYDSDGDGELSETERQALAAAIRAQLRAGQRPGLPGAGGH